MGSSTQRIDDMREFFGFGGYQREAEGYFSAEHLIFVTLLMILMVTLSVVLGLTYKNRSDKEKNKVLIATAVLIDAFELFKIVLCCIRSNNPMDWLYNLPLFLCSIQLIVIPIAAFSRGRLKAAALDFVFIFGILGAVLGTYFAGNIYSVFPVLSFDTVISGITHSMSGFASLYIAISGLKSMEKKNIPICIFILTGFCVAAYVANILVDYNYMFLMRGDGTPYDIFYNLVNGNKILYPAIVILLLFLYIFAFYGIYILIQKKRKSTVDREQTAELNIT